MRVWLVTAGGGLIALAYARRLPLRPQAGMLGRDIENLVLYAVSGLLLVAILTARRMPMVAASSTAIAGAAFAALTRSEHNGTIGMLTIVVFGAPVVAFMLSSRTAVVVAAGLAVAVFASMTMVYRQHYGPTTPVSATPPLTVDRVRWAWAGAVTASSVTVKAELVGSASSVRLAIGADPSLNTPSFSLAAAPDRHGIVELRVDGLRADTEHFYAIEIDGVLDRHHRGSFRTFPLGQASFRFAFAACSRTGSNSAVFDAVRRADPLLFLNLGDFHYSNVDTNNAARFRAAYRSNLTAPAQAALLREVPVAYVWDDHDFGANDSNGMSRSRPAAMETYRQLAPHYPLASESSPIYQAFTVGRVRFVLTDSRSMRSPQSQPDDDRKTMLGADQLDWFEAELKNASKYALVVWANPVPWVSEAGSDNDHWAGYATERAKIADTISSLTIKNLVMISGDIHALAVDDGSHSDYSTARTGGFPVLHAAPLDRPGVVKGGPYSEGTSTRSGQFGVVDVTDLGDRVRVAFEGRDHTGAVRVAYTVELPSPVR